MTSQVVKIVDSTRHEIFGDLAGWDGITDVATKEHSELVTEFDIRSSNCLIDRLSRNFQGVPVISEESPASAFPDLPDLFWLIDPLDGTLNFIRGIPYVSISVSLVQNGLPVIGVTGDIFTGNDYYAYDGGGFYRNGLQLRREKNPSGTILSTGVCHDRSLHARHINNVSAVFRHFTDFRRLGGACLDLCFLCEGKFNAMFEILKPWDCYAGMVMAREVGLTVFVPKPVKVINKELYFVCGEKELVELIKRDADLDL
jgi:myo-inositol-1(or 4)-monophosphatase